jgi:hypothetical protein
VIIHRLDDGFFTGSDNGRLWLFLCEDADGKKQQHQNNSHSHGDRDKDKVCDKTNSIQAGGN